MGKIIMITSCKGGVGKTTVAANLASVLAKNGSRVTVVDCDFSMRCLDLVMGAQDRVIFDFSDLLTDKKTLDEVYVCGFESENLRFIAAPYDLDADIDPETFRKKVELIAEDADIVLLDTPGSRADVMFSLAAGVADAALVVATHQSSSIRAAERTAQEISDMGCSDCSLLINNFDFNAVSRGTLPGIIEMIDRTAIRLIGAVPYDQRIGELQEKGWLIGSEAAKDMNSSNAAMAFGNISKRLMGKNVRLFDGFRGIKRHLFLK